MIPMIAITTSSSAAVKPALAACIRRCSLTGSVVLARWARDRVGSVAEKYYEGYTLLEAHMEIPRNAVVGVLDSVRNKALKFALEIERVAPAAGEVSPGAKPVPDERVSQIFNTYIMGGA